MEWMNMGIFLHPSLTAMKHQSPGRENAEDVCWATCSLIHKSSGSMVSSDNFPQKKLKYWAKEERDCLMTTPILGTASYRENGWILSSQRWQLWLCFSLSLVTFLIICLSFLLSSPDLSSSPSTSEILLLPKACNPVPSPRSLHSHLGPHWLCLSPNSSDLGHQHSCG